MSRYHGIETQLRKNNNINGGYQFIIEEPAANRSHMHNGISSQSSYNLQNDFILSVDQGKQQHNERKKKETDLRFLGPNVDL